MYDASALFLPYCADNSKTDLVTMAGLPDGFLDSFLGASLGRQYFSAHPLVSPGRSCLVRPAWGSYG